MRKKELRRKKGRLSPRMFRRFQYQGRVQRRKTRPMQKLSRVNSRGNLRKLLKERILIFQGKKRLVRNLHQRRRNPFSVVSLLGARAKNQKVILEALLLKRQKRKKVSKETRSSRVRVCQQSLKIKLNYRL